MFYLITASCFQMLNSARVYCVDATLYTNHALTSSNNINFISKFKYKIVNVSIHSQIDCILANSNLVVQSFSVAGEPDKPEPIGPRTMQMAADKSLQPGFTSLQILNLMTRNSISILNFKVPESITIRRSKPSEIYTVKYTGTQNK